MNPHLPITWLWGGGVVAMAPFEDRRMGAIGAKDMDHATGWWHVSSGKSLADEWGSWLRTWVPNL
jgi:hypothetical protein